MTLKNRFHSNTTGITVAGAGNTTLITLDMRNTTELFVEIVVATQDLDAFIILGRATDDGSYLTLFSTAGDYTLPAGDLIAASSNNLTTLAAGTSGWFRMNVTAYDSLRLQASAVADSASVSVFVGGESNG